MTKVLNSQSDAILAYEKIDKDKNLSFLFSNQKCTNLFQYNFAAKTDESTKSNQVRGNPIEDRLFKRMDFKPKSNSSADREINSGERLSLKQVLLESEQNTPNLEQFAMTSIENNEEDITVLLKRNNLMMNDKECQVVNFVDISTYKKLE